MKARTSIKLERFYPITKSRLNMLPFPPNKTYLSTIGNLHHLRPLLQRLWGLLHHNRHIYWTFNTLKKNGYLKVLIGCVERLQQGKGGGVAKRYRKGAG